VKSGRRYNRTQNRCNGPKRLRTRGRRTSTRVQEVPQLWSNTVNRLAKIQTVISTAFVLLLCAKLASASWTLWHYYSATGN
jgi:hypothetical protein